MLFHIYNHGRMCNRDLSLWELCSETSLACILVLVTIKLTFFFIISLSTVATVAIVSFWISSKVFPKDFPSVFLKGIFFGNWLNLVLEALSTKLSSTHNSSRCYVIWYGYKARNFFVLDYLQNSVNLNYNFFQTWQSSFEMSPRRFWIVSKSLGWSRWDCFFWSYKLNVTTARIMAHFYQKVM